MLPPRSPTTEMKLLHTLLAAFLCFLFPLGKHRHDINSNWSYQWKLFWFCFAPHLAGYNLHIDKEWKDLELTALCASAESYDHAVYIKYI